MHQFTVWAPAATRVMLHLPTLDRREPMRRVHQPAPEDNPDPGGRVDPDSGWWSVSVPDAGPGTDYAMKFIRAAWKYHGVSAERLMPVGYGEAEATYPADGNEADRSLDRRVVVFRMR